MTHIWFNLSSLIFFSSFCHSISYTGMYIVYRRHHVTSETVRQNTKQMPTLWISISIWADDLIFKLIRANLLCVNFSLCLPFILFHAVVYSTYVCSSMHMTLIHQFLTHHCIEWTHTLVLIIGMHSTVPGFFSISNSSYLPLHSVYVIFFFFLKLTTSGRDYFERWHQWIFKLKYLTSW